jgi:hypothetical protein
LIEALGASEAVIIGHDRGAAAAYGRSRSAPTSRLRGGG